MPQIEQINALTAAVESAYVVFARYRPGLQLATCRCPQCMDDQTEQLLLKTPLREIDRELLSEYTWSANGRNDINFNADEHRHFLPRYFDLIAAGVWPCFSDETTTLRQLGAIAFRASWPANEVAIIDTFFSTLLAREIAKPLIWNKSEKGDDLAWSTVEDTMCAIACGGGDVVPLLSLLEDANFEFANDHLACLAASCDDGAERYGLWSPFWSGAADQAQVVAAWIRRPETIVRLQNALPTIASGKEAGLFENAISVLERLIQKRDAD